MAMKGLYHRRMRGGIFQIDIEDFDAERAFNGVYAHGECLHSRPEFGMLTELWPEVFAARVQSFVRSVALHAGHWMRQSSGGTEASNSPV